MAQPADGGRPYAAAGLRAHRANVAAAQAILGREYPDQSLLHQVQSVLVSSEPYAALAVWGDAFDLAAGELIRKLRRFQQRPAPLSQAVEHTEPDLLGIDRPVPTRRPGSPEMCVPMPVKNGGVGPQVDLGPPVGGRFRADLPGPKVGGVIQPLLADLNREWCAIDRADDRGCRGLAIPEQHQFRLFGGHPDAIGRHHQSAQVAGHDHLGARGAGVRMIPPQPQWATWHKVVESSHPNRAVPDRLRLQHETLRQAIRERGEFQTANPEQPAKNTRPNGPIGVLGQTPHHLPHRLERRRVVRGERPELPAVEARQAIFRSHPEVTVAGLQHRFHRVAGQRILRGVTPMQPTPGRRRHHIGRNLDADPARPRRQARRRVPGGSTGHPRRVQRAHLSILKHAIKGAQIPQRSVKGVVLTLHRTAHREPPAARWPRMGAPALERQTAVHPDPAGALRFSGDGDMIPDLGSQHDVFDPIRLPIVVGADKILRMQVGLKQPLRIRRLLPQHAAIEVDLPNSHPERQREHLVRDRRLQLHPSSVPTKLRLVLRPRLDGWQQPHHHAFLAGDFVAHIEEIRPPADQAVSHR